MKTLQEILTAAYTGDPEKDFRIYLAVHHFVMDDSNTYADRASALRDMTVRGLGHPSILAGDVDLVETYIKAFSDVFGRR